VQSVRLRNLCASSGRQFLSGLEAGEDIGAIRVSDANLLPSRGLAPEYRDARPWEIEPVREEGTASGVCRALHRRSSQAKHETLRALTYELVS
jgi:hypothetical protein